MTGAQDLKKTQEATSECWMDWALRYLPGSWGSPDLKWGCLGQEADFQEWKVWKWAKTTRWEQGLLIQRVLEQGGFRCAQVEGCWQGELELGWQEGSIQWSWFGENIWLFLAGPELEARAKSIRKLAVIDQVLAIWGQWRQRMWVRVLLSWMIWPLSLCIFSLSRERDRKKRQVSKRKRTHFWNKNQHVCSSSESYNHGASHGSLAHGFLTINTTRRVCHLTFVFFVFVLRYLR